MTEKFDDIVGRLAIFLALIVSPIYTLYFAVSVYRGDAWVSDPMLQIGVIPSAVLTFAVMWFVGKYVIKGS
jgi:hypothetical protein